MFSFINFSTFATRPARLDGFMIHVATDTFDVSIGWKTSSGSTWWSSADYLPADEYLEPGARDIRSYGADPTTGNDTSIGAIVDAAMTAADVTDLGGTVYIPRRFGLNPSGYPFWKWSTLTQVFGDRSQTLCLQGDEGGAYVLLGGTTPFSCGQYGWIHVTKIVAIGANSNTTDCPAGFEIGECRRAEISYSTFLGLRTNASQTGLNLGNSDTVHIHDNSYVSCDYVGTAGQGGVVVTHGSTQGVLMERLRFTALDGSQGLPVYQKGGSAGNVHIYLGGQDDPALGQALAPMVVRGLYSESGAPRGVIEINGTKGGTQPTMICGPVIVEESAIDCGGIVLRGDTFTSLEFRDSSIGNNADTSVAFMLGNAQRAIFRRVRVSGTLARLKIQWTAAVARAELHDCMQLRMDGTVNTNLGLIVDESSFTPASTLIYTGGVYTTGAKTTVAAGSNGAVLPQGTVNVASSAAFNASGTGYLEVVGGAIVTFAWTGKGAGTLTGCTFGGSGTLATGGAVLQGTARPFPSMCKYWLIRNASFGMREEYCNGTDWYDAIGTVVT